MLGELHHTGQGVSPPAAVYEPEQVVLHALALARCGRVDVLRPLNLVAMVDNEEINPNRISSVKR